MGFIGDLFHTVMIHLFASGSEKLDQAERARSLAGTRYSVWDAEVVAQIISVYDPLPDSSDAPAAYSEVASVLDENLRPQDWQSRETVHALLAREVRRRAQLDEVSESALHRAAKQLVREYRRFRDRARAFN
mgnify:CR=1 FL=1